MGKKNQKAVVKAAAPPAPVPLPPPVPKNNYERVFANNDRELISIDDANALINEYIVLAVENRTRSKILDLLNVKSEEKYVNQVRHKAKCKVEEESSTANA
jgi:hypothetical protein